jgi:hypothetical protein
VCGVSESSAPKVTTSRMSSSWITPSSSRQKLRQRMFGSIPRTITRSYDAPGGRHTENRVVGQVTRRATPSTSETVGRFTWKS